MGENGGKWGEMGACACACAYVSPFAEGGDLPAPMVFSVSVRSYIAIYTPGEMGGMGGNGGKRGETGGNGGEWGELVGEWESSS